MLQLPMRCARLSYDLYDSSEGDRAKLRCDQQCSSMCSKTHLHAHLTCAGVSWRVYTTGFCFFFSGVLVQRTSDLEPKFLETKIHTVWQGLEPRLSEFAILVLKTASTRVSLLVTFSLRRVSRPRGRVDQNSSGNTAVTLECVHTFEQP